MDRQRRVVVRVMYACSTHSAEGRGWGAQGFREVRRVPIMNAIVFLDDQDVENGATRLVPNR